MKNWLLIAVAGVVTGAVGFTLIQQVSAPHSSGNRVGDAQAATPATVVALPDFSLPNRAGEKQSIRSWPGKSMIINFWATWCAPCRKEIPLLKEIAKEQSKDGFQVVGIAIDFRDDVLKYADEIKMDYPLLIGEQEGLAAADAFGVNAAGLPFTVFTDARGRIVTLLMGELTREKSKIILAGVQRVNKGELTPDAARGSIASALGKLPMSAH